MKTITQIILSLITFSLLALTFNTSPCSADDATALIYSPNTWVPRVNPNSCNKALSGSYGSFHSPKFPANYPDFLHCTWSITVQQGYHVVLRFTEFDVEYYPNCTYDYVKISDSDGPIGTYCGRRGTEEDEAVPTKSDVIVSRGNRVMVEFNSDFSNEETFHGFKVHYRAVDLNECSVDNGGCDHLCHNYLGGHYCSCRLHYQLKGDGKLCDYALCKNVVLRALQGEIKTPEFPANYPAHTECSWKIVVPRGYRIVLAFTTFEIEDHPEANCPYDYVHVTAGRNFGRLCGTIPPGNIVSKSTLMSIKFVSDESNHMKGFSARYHVEGVKCSALVAPDHGVMNASGFSFKDQVSFTCDPGYVLNGADAVWCRSTGDWTKSTPVCEPISCGHPGVPAKGSLLGDVFTFTETVRFKCDDFYEIDGEEELTCEQDGEWSDELPECVPVCGNSSFANAYRQACRGNIVGGNDAVRGSYPWHVQIKKDGVGICGGSLVNEFWVVTAAHCVVSKHFHVVIRPHRLQVVLGLHNRSSSNDSHVKTINVGQVFEHRDFDWKTFHADIALLRLTEPVIMNHFVKPICLPDTDSSSDVIKPGVRGVVAGWGRTSNTKTFPAILQEACLPVIGMNVCRLAYAKERYLIMGDMFCAGPQDGGQDVCKGDSGGGYIFNDPSDSRWFLGGVVSWGSDQGCAVANKYSVYIKVEEYLDWIEERIFR